MNEYLQLRYVLEFSVIIPAVVFALIPVREEFKFKSIISYISIGVLIFCLIVLGAFMRAEYYLKSVVILVPYAVIFFVVYIVSVNSSLGRKLFCYFNSIMLCTFCPLYTVFLMADIEAENDIWDSAGLFTIQSSIVYIILLLVIGLIFFRTLYIKLPMLMTQEYIGSVWNFLFLVPMFMAGLMWWSIPLHPNLATVGRLRPAALIFLWLILMMILLLYHVFWWTAEKITRGAKLQQENTLLMMEGKRYEELRKYMDDTRAIRHDFRQHILVMNQLAGAGNLSELQDYLNQFSEVSSGGYTGYSQNIAVDAVASYYAAFAESQGTKITWKLNLPHNFPMNESEYCVILGNLLENSLSAVKNLPEEYRYVNVISSLLSESIIGLSIDNPYSGKIILGRNGLPVSVREGHGVGLVSVRNTVRCYGGSMNIKTSNNIFSVDIVIYCS